MNKIDQESIATIVHRAVLDCLAANRSRQIAADNPMHIFTSPEANALKEEIVRVGRKLWERQYVDGNGGNISVRLSPQYVLCTPTLCSKGDLRVEDMSLVDLENYQICGDRPQTSEILLHLEIYKAVPAAKAVIHCHPPYATAHAVAGVVPQGNLIPEQEVFVGPVALAPYDTPGTQAFAQTVLPRRRNSACPPLRLCIFLRTDFGAIKNKENLKHGRPTASNRGCKRMPKKQHGTRP